MSETHRQLGANPIRRRGLGGLLMAHIVVILAACAVALAFGIVQKQPYAFTPVPRAAYIDSSNPITLAVAGKPPNSTDKKPLSPSPDVRAIVVHPERIKMLAGGQLQREIKLAKPLTTLQAVVDTIADPGWIANGDDKTKVILHVALIFERDVTMTIVSPTTVHITMVGPPGVFIASHVATVTFNGVLVDTQKVPGAPETPYRSFVMASGGTMNVTDSTFTGLGWDRNSSYGASWGDSATGDVTNSTFEGNFIGLYTAKVHDMAFRGCKFLNNDLYGIDPHTYSTNLVIDHVLAEGNKAHGIIFSDNVTGSTITNSVSRNNGENGIMMDKLSTDNLMQNNEVYDNYGDGIVTADSPNNRVIGNLVKNNRVGIRIASADTDTTVVTGNTIVENHVATEGLPNLDDSNENHDNGDQWKRQTVLAIAVIAGSVMAVITVIFLVRRARLNRRDYQRQADIIISAREQNPPD